MLDWERCTHSCSCVCFDLVAYASGTVVYTTDFEDLKRQRWLVLKLITFPIHPTMLTETIQALELAYHVENSATFTYLFLAMCVPTLSTSRPYLITQTDLERQPWLVLKPKTFLRHSITLTEMIYRRWSLRIMSKIALHSHNLSLCVSTLSTSIVGCNSSTRRN